VLGRSFNTGGVSGEEEGGGGRRRGASLSSLEEFVSGAVIDLRWLFVLQVHYDS